MKVLVTGVGGQLGHDVMNELAKRGYEGVGSDIAPAYSGVADGSAVTTMPYVPMDITNAAAVAETIKSVNPDVIVHCAAWTAVDLAEDEDKKAKVFAINAEGTENIARVAKEIDAKMVYISTDYVFDGQGTSPWKPDGFVLLSLHEASTRRYPQDEGYCALCARGRLCVSQAAVQDGLYSLCRTFRGVPCAGTARHPESVRAGGILDGRFL